jgi:hypothetical protein
MGPGRAPLGQHSDSSGNLEGMSGLFPQREHTDPWFRIGRLEVSSVMFVVLAVVTSWLGWVVLRDWTSLLAYSPQAMAGGQVWRLISWPFAGGLSLWSVLTLFFFWYFGTELESQIGRRSMLGLLLGIWGSLTITYTLTAFLFSSTTALAGIDLIEFMLLLLWIAEYPGRPLFFGIKAWVFGAVILGVQALTMVAYRDIAGLLALILSLALVAIAARRSGLLAHFAWIPGRPGKRRPKPVKVPRAQVKATARRASDQERMDTLLDQISEHGLHSLSEAQRKELKKLSDRRRQG